MEEELQRAMELQRQIDALYKQQDKLLDPLVKKAVEEDDPNKTMQLVRRLWIGFHRTELRAHHINRMNNYEYRRRYTGE